jgi:hypothetical protein
MSRYRRSTALWCILLVCSSTLGSCGVYRGPLTRDPGHSLPQDALREKTADLEYYDPIEIRFTDGSSVKRRFRAVRGDALLSFTGRGDSRREYADPLRTISGIRSREVQAVRTLLAAAAVAGAVLFISFLVECSSGCFE